MGLTRWAVDRADVVHGHHRSRLVGEGGAGRILRAMSEEPAPKRTGYHVLLTAAAAMLVIKGMQVAANLLIPIVLAAFIAITCARPMRWLQEKGFPQWAALLSVAGLAITGFVGLSFFVGAVIVDFTNPENLETYTSQLGTLTEKAVALIERLDIDISADALRSEVDPGSIVNIFSDAVGRLGSFLGNVFVVVLTVVFIIAEAAGFPRKMAVAFGVEDDEIARFSNVVGDVQRYLGIKTWISLLTGLMILISCWALGVDYALLWALLGFLLNYIPTIGSIVAAVPAVLLALIQVGWEKAAILAGLYVAINVIVGSVLEPKVMGQTLGLSTLVVFISLLFWNFVWGPVGMLLSIPLTMLVKILFENSDDLKWVAVLMGTGAEARALHEKGVALYKKTGAEVVNPTDD